MPTIHIIAVGKVKSGPIQALCDEYIKRLSWHVVIKELPTTEAVQEQAALLAAIHPKYPLLALDERGQSITSPELSKWIQGRFTQGHNDLQVIIGGADGLDDALRARADKIISFGTATWPHMLVRVMILEQLYRAETILAGHPYHRG